MKKLTYLTSNIYKFREAKEVLADQYGFDLEIMDPDFELYEIQAKTCAEVVAFTAKYGADKYTLCAYINNFRIFVGF